MAEGQNAERQWRRQDLAEGVVQLVIVAEGQNAERQWRQTAWRHPHLHRRLCCGGRLPKGNGDLPSGLWVLGLESEDVVAGEQNIERQSVFLKGVFAPRFLKDSG